MTENQTLPDIGDVQPEKTNAKDKIFNKFAFLAIGFVAVALIVVFYWLITGQNAITLNSPLRVQPTVVKTEKEVDVIASFCKETDAPGRLVRRLVSESSELFAPTETEPLKKGCYEDFKFSVPLPDTLTKGEYRVYYRITYQTTPVTSVTEDFYSEAFRVTD